MIAPALRTAGFTDSVIRRMTRVCLKYDALNLAQGFPDDDPPPEVKAALARAAVCGPHQYAVTWGAPALRQALAAKIERTAGYAVDPESELCITCGSTEAMMASVLAVLNPGAKAAVFSPFYENYGADAVLCGAEPVYVPLVPPEFKFDPEVLEQAFKDGARALILCNPSNPCGKVFSLEELTCIADIVKRYDALVITDEVYEHIVFAPYRHLHLRALPGMQERTLVCGSLSKTYSMTGWRLGWVEGPAVLLDAVKKVHDFLTVGAAAPLQAAAVSALTLPESYYQQLQETYTARRACLLDGLDALGLAHTVPQGSYFVLLDISSFNYLSDLEFCLDLAAKVGVGAVPGSAFFKEPVNNYIRLHFAKDESVLKEALRRLARIDLLRR